METRTILLSVGAAALIGATIYAFRKPAAAAIPAGSFIRPGYSIGPLCRGVVVTSRAAANEYAWAAGQASPSTAEAAELTWPVDLYGPICGGLGANEFAARFDARQHGFLLWLLAYWLRARVLAGKLERDDALLIFATRRNLLVIAGVPEAHLPPSGAVLA